MSPAMAARPARSGCPRRNSSRSVGVASRIACWKGPYHRRTVCIGFEPFAARSATHGVVLGYRAELGRKICRGQGIDLGKLHRPSPMMARVCAPSRSRASQVVASPGPASTRSEPGSALPVVASSPAPAEAGRSPERCSPAVVGGKPSVSPRLGGRRDRRPPARTRYVSVEKPRSVPAPVDYASRACARYALADDEDNAW